MDMLLTYDVATADLAGQRRLRRVAKVCEGFGVRVQQSVFELVIDPHEVPILLRLLERKIDAAADSVRLYRLDHRGPLEVLGIGRSITTTRGPLVL